MFCWSSHWWHCWQFLFHPRQTRSRLHVPYGGGGSTPVTVEVEAVPIMVESTTDDYFVLYVLHDLGGGELRIPVLVALGGNGTTTLSENLPALPKERYHLEKYPVSEPADIDGDCIDDITELENPVGMSPINRNPVNPNSIDLIDGAMTIPDLETFNALSIFHPHTGTWFSCIIGW